MRVLPSSTGASKMYWWKELVAVRSIHVTSWFGPWCQEPARPDAARRPASSCSAVL